MRGRTRSPSNPMSNPNHFILWGGHHSCDVGHAQAARMNINWQRYTKANRLPTAASHPSSLVPRPTTPAALCRVQPPHPPHSIANRPNHLPLPQCCCATAGALPGPGPCVVHELQAMALGWLVGWSVGMVNKQGSARCGMDGWLVGELGWRATTSALLVDGTEGDQIYQPTRLSLGERRVRPPVTAINRPGCTSAHRVGSSASPSAVRRGG